MHTNATVAPHKPSLLRVQTANPAWREDTGELEARNRELSAYAQTVAHDLKDPLSVIIATSDAIFHISDLTPEELRVYLQQIQSSAYAMDEMIDNILLMAELGKAAAPVETLDMGIIVAHVRARLSYLINQRGARISVPETWPTAVGYGPWIEEVWANFISNAIKYGGQPPQVELGASTRPDGVVFFWTRDNGAGLSQKAQARLFQQDSELSPVRMQGHGLGLSIARRIVEKLGGQVGVETQPGQGSTFFFTLPAAM